MQIDTLSIWFPTSRTVTQFTAVARISKWAVAMAASRAPAKQFLDRLIDKAPFPIKAIQVGGGSEFQADSDHACADQCIELCVLPPRSPTLKGRLERLQATFRHGSYASYPLLHQIEPLNRLPDDFNDHYSYQRPHQALGGLTPVAVSPAHTGLETSRVS